MRAATSVTDTTTKGWTRPAAAASLGLWGLLHLVGGTSLITMGASAGLDTLGPNAPTPAPRDSGEAAEALLHFHGLNIAAAGLAVLVLAIAWYRSQRAWQANVSLGVAVVLDTGLLLFLVAPGLLPASQGLLGPGLLAVAAACYLTHLASRPADPRPGPNPIPSTAKAAR